MEVARCDHNNIVDGGNGLFTYCRQTAHYSRTQVTFTGYSLRCTTFRTSLSITVRHTDCLQSKIDAAGCNIPTARFAAP
jgi:hypothetical protein